MSVVLGRGAGLPRLVVSTFRPGVTLCAASKLVQPGDVPHRKQAVKGQDKRPIAALDSLPPMRQADGRRAKHDYFIVDTIEQMCYYKRARETFTRWHFGALWP